MKLQVVLVCIVSALIPSYESVKSNGKYALISEKTMRGGLPKHIYPLSHDVSHMDSMVKGHLLNVSPQRPEGVLEWASKVTTPQSKDLEYFYRYYELYKNDSRLGELYKSRWLAFFKSYTNRHLGLERSTDSLENSHSRLPDLKRDYLKSLNKLNQIEKDEFKIILFNLMGYNDGLDIVKLAISKLHHPTLDCIGLLNLYIYLMHDSESEGYILLNRQSTLLFEHVLDTRYRKATRYSLRVDRFKKLKEIMNGISKLNSSQYDIIMKQLLFFNGVMPADTMNSYIILLSRKLMNPGKEDLGSFLDNLSRHINDSRLIATIRAVLDV